MQENLTLLQGAFQEHHCSAKQMPICTNTSSWKFTLRSEALSPVIAQHRSLISALLMSATVGLLFQTSAVCVCQLWYTKASKKPSWTHSYPDKSQFLISHNKYFRLFLTSRLSHCHFLIYLSFSVALESQLMCLCMYWQYYILNKGKVKFNLNIQNHRAFIFLTS